MKQSLTPGNQFTHKTKLLFLLPIGGEPDYGKLSANLAFGEGNSIVAEGRNVTVQCISGTGSLRVGANFLSSHFPGNKTIYFPKPSWGNHTPIFKHAGVNVDGYRYYDPKTCGLDFAAACEDISVSFFEQHMFLCTYLPRFL